MVKEYQKHFVAHTGNDNFNFSSLEGYIAAKVFVEGLRRAGPKPTRQGFIAALETLRDFDLGGFNVTYTPLDHNGSKFVELTVIGRDGKFLR